MNTLKRGFTVIEIIIVVVLVGILCAAAVPAVNQYQATHAQATMQDDAARLGSAAQTYFAETFTRSVILKYDPETGKLEAPDAFQMSSGNRIAAGYQIQNELRIEMNKVDAFTLTHPKGGSYTFDDKGNLTKTEE